MANKVEISVETKDNTNWSGLKEKIGTAFAGIGAVIAGSDVLAMAGPLAAVGLALGAFAAVAAPDLEKVKKALTSTGAAGVKAWANLDPAQRDLAHDIQGLQHDFDNLQHSLEPVISKVLDLAVKVAHDLLPALGPLAKTGATVISDFLKPLDQLLQSDYFKKFIEQMQKLAMDVAPTLGKSLVNLLKAFMNLFEKAGPAGADMLNGLLKLVVTFVQNLIPFIAWIAKVSDAFGKWVGANKLVFGSLLLVGAGVTIATGGINLVILAIVSLIAYITYLWKTSETFRVVSSQVTSDVVGFYLGMYKAVVTILHDMSDAFLNALKVMLEVAARIPGPWQNMAKSLLDSLNNFQHGVDNTFNNAQNTLQRWRTTLSNLPKIVKLQGDITDLRQKIAQGLALLKNPNLTATRRAKIEADITQARNEISQIESELNNLNGKTANTYVNTYVKTIAIGGGKYINSGPDAMSPSASNRGFNSQLFTPRASGRSDTHMMARDHHVKVTIDFDFRGADQEMVRFLRKSIRIKGGNVQKVLGH